MAAIIFVVLFASAILGTFIRERLPAHHLADDSRHLIEVSLGVIGTIAGLVLGLLVATSFGTFQAQRTAVIQMAAEIALIDRGLAIYGPQAQPAREQLKAVTAHMLSDIWPTNPRGESLNPSSAGGARFYETIQELDAKTDIQKTIKGQVLGAAVDVAQQRWLMYAQQAASISPALIGVLVFWFAITFLAFGLMAVRNGTTITALVLCSFAVAGAVYLILQLSSPFYGEIKVPDAPLRQVYTLLGR